MAGKKRVEEKEGYESRRGLRGGRGERGTIPSAVTTRLAAAE